MQNSCYSLRSPGTFITKHKPVVIQKLPTSFTPVFSASGVGDGENVYRPLKSEEKLHTLSVKLPWFYSLPAVLVLVEVLCFQLFSEQLLIA